MKNYIKKRLEEFEKNVDLIEDLIKVVSDTDVLDTQDVEYYYRDADRIINGSAINNAWEALRLKGKLKELFADSIHQALAEERERMRGMTEKMKKIIRIGHVGNDTSKAYDMGQNNGYNKALADLLASLDKPLTGDEK